MHTHPGIEIYHWILADLSSCISTIMHLRIFDNLGVTGPLKLGMWAIGLPCHFPQ